MDAVNIDSELDIYGSYCSPLPDFPGSGSQSGGGLVNDRIVVCGGYFKGLSQLPGIPFPTNQCYALEATGWDYIGNLTNPKYDHGNK